MEQAIISIIIFILGVRLGWAWCKSYYMVTKTTAVLRIVSEVVSGKMTSEEAKKAFEELED